LELVALLISLTVVSPREQKRKKNVDHVDAPSSDEIY
jgi:hypothetical protein